MALPFGLDMLYFGLAIVAVGTGFLKSTVSVMLGQLYAKQDVKRDSAYTLFYMGINLGSILAGLIIAYVAEMINWHYGFALAAIGMFMGLIIFLCGYKKGYYSDQSNVVKTANLRRKILLFNCGIWLIIGSILIVAAIFYLLSAPGNTKIVITMISFGMLFYIGFLAIRSKTSTERNQLFSILVFIITAIFFWSLYKQSFNSLALFIDKDIQRSVMGHTIPSSMFVLVPNAAFIIILASVFAKIWLKLEACGKNPSAPIKFLLGLLFTLASFSTFALGAYLAYTTGDKSSMLWPLLGILLLTCAELCISPVGLSIVSKMSPLRLSGFLMGAWFLASSIGSYVSGLLSSFVQLPKGVLDVRISAHAYFKLFAFCSLGMACVVVIFMLCLPLIKRLTNSQTPANNLSI